MRKVMKDFLKYTLATIIGVILSGTILFFIGAAILFGIVASSESEVKVKPNSVMMLNFNGNVVERSQNNPLQQFFGDKFGNYGLDDILSSIKKAKDINDIKGIYIQANSLGASFATAEEIRNALIDFKKSGKFIIAYADSYTQTMYYISSVADKVFLNPQGAIEWRGISSQPIFYKDLLQKIGIEMQVFKVGTYKSAVEPFIATEMSPANREQVTNFIGSIWNQLLSDVSVSRKISKDTLNEYADRMFMFHPAEESVKARLADSLIYRSEIKSYLKEISRIKGSDDLNILGLEDMVNVQRNVPMNKSGNCIAIYYAYGEIDNGMDNEEEAINSEKVIRDLGKLAKDDDVKAVVLRVNSPGGSAFGSEQIWHAVKTLKEKKPVIVSMGDYAASGGYYISCAADYILAEPTTLTGSIGIFGMIPNIKGLTDKIGITFDVVKTNKYSDIGNMSRELSNDERSLIQMSVNQGYDLFIKRCAEGRNMSIDKLEKIAEGRVWTGSEAKRIGLIDELGGVNDALAIAAQRANIEEYTVVNLPEKVDFFSSLFEQDPSNYIKSMLIKGSIGEYYKTFDFIKSLEKADYMQARVPFDLNLK